MSDQNASGRLPGGTFPPGLPGGDDPEFPWPGSPFRGGPPSPGRPEPGPVPPARVWIDPHAGWQDKLYGLPGNDPANQAAVPECRLVSGRHAVVG
jgi:hypothetical protein